MKSFIQNGIASVPTTTVNFTSTGVLIHEMQHSVDPLVKSTYNKDFPITNYDIFTGEKLNYPRKYNGIPLNSRKIMQDAKQIMTEKQYNLFERRVIMHPSAKVEGGKAAEALSYFAMYAPKEVMNPTTTTGKYINENLYRYGNRQVNTKNSRSNQVNQKTADLSTSVIDPLNRFKESQVSSSIKPVQNQLEAMDLLINKRPVYSVERSVILNPYETQSMQAKIISTAGNKQINVKYTPDSINKENLKFIKDQGFLNIVDNRIPENEFLFTKFRENQFINPKNVARNEFIVSGPRVAPRVFNTQYTSLLDIPGAMQLKSEYTSIKDSAQIPIINDYPVSKPEKYLTPSESSKIVSNLNKQYIDTYKPDPYNPVSYKPDPYDPGPGPPVSYKPDPYDPGPGPPVPYKPGPYDPDPYIDTYPPSPYAPYTPYIGGGYIGFPGMATPPSPSIGFGGGSKKAPIEKSRGKKQLIQVKSSLFRKFAFGEKDIYVTKESLAAFKEKIAQKGTFFGYDAIPTAEQAARAEQKLLQSQAEGKILKGQRSILDIKV